MAHHVFVRPIRPEEIKQFFQWAVATPHNDFDPAVVNYGGSSVLCAYDHAGPVVYMPTQRPLFIESIAVRPGAPAALVATALKELVQTLITHAHVQSIGELYFLCDATSAAALAGHLAANQVFERVPLELYRLKLANLEPKQE
jgi:hypothetical protein